MTLLAERFPRLAAYVDSLPDGIDSFPECRAKASLVHFGTKRLPVNFPTKGLPERIERHLRDPRLVTDWISEVDYNAATLALWDGHGIDDDAACEAWYDVTHALRTSRVYRLLLEFVSPGRVVRGAPVIWQQFHRGTTLNVTDETAESTIFELVTPARLFPSIILRAYASVFQGAMESRPTRLEERMLHPSSKLGCARYLVRY
jgi:hypothetical protein